MKVAAARYGRKLRAPKGEKKMSRMEEYHLVTKKMLINLAHEVIRKCREFNDFVVDGEMALASDEHTEIMGMMKAMKELGIEMTIEYKDDGFLINYFEFDVLDYGWYV